ncbi:MAG TPA: tetratricopeptide repeat protein, partial [Verrucomicrobiota bacterium]|nr:tetratricopeptide repeat protein [Verrucomicrobiota bacterium]
APSSFAPVAQDHPLASVWNDPEFQKSLVGNYGFAPEVEPRLSPEEQQYYRDKIVPLLRDDQSKTISELKSSIKPEGSALFDFTLGNLYFQNDDLTNAVKCFEQATVKFPSFRRAWKSLGFALVRDGRYDEAVGPLTRTIALGGGDGKAFGLLGFSYMNAEKYVSASSAYKQAMLFEPDNVDFKLGIVKCEVAVENYDAALALLDELIQSHPDRESLWAIQANVYLQKEMTSKAAVNFEVLRRMNKATAENLMTLGDIYMTQEANELALSAYLEAVEKDNWQHPARALRAAEILAGRGAWEQAQSLFKKIRDTAGSNLSAQDEMKLLKIESKVAMSNGQGEQAIVVLEQIIERNPLDGEALLLAGDYYARNGQPEKAEFRYDTASKLQGFEAEAFVKQAQLLVKSGKYAQATDVLKKAQKINPRDNVQRYLDKVEQLARSAGRS